jgi:CheY-like chemotaxis protein
VPRVAGNSVVKTVLVVEDDVDIRKLVADFLEMLGYTVAACENGREALEQVARGVPDLILLDLMMPVMDGRQFSAALKRDPPTASVPLVLMSASPEAPRVSIEIGARGCLRKPFDLDQLADAVARFENPAP